MKVKQKSPLKPLKNESFLTVKKGVLIFTGTTRQDIATAIKSDLKKRLKKIAFFTKNKTLRHLRITSDATQRSPGAAAF